MADENIPKKSLSVYEMFFVISMVCQWIINFVFNYWLMHFGFNLQNIDVFGLTSNMKRAIWDNYFLVLPLNLFWVLAIVIQILYFWRVKE